MDLDEADNLVRHKSMKEILKLFLPNEVVQQNYASN